MPKQKGILLMVRWSVAIRVFHSDFWMTLELFREEAGKTDEILYVQAFLLLSGKIKE